MNRSTIHTFKHILLLVTCLSVAISYAQNSTIKPTTLIKDYKEKAVKAIVELDFNEAVKNISEANKLAATIGDFDLKAEVMVTNTLLEYYFQNYDKASKINKNAIEIIKASENQKNLPDSYVLQGLISTRQGKYGIATFYYDKADSIHNLTNNKKGKARILLGRGFLEFKKGNLKVAISYYNTGISESKKFKFQYQEAFSLLNKAEALLAINDENANYLEQAKTSLADANAIIDKKKYNKLKIDSYKIESLIAIKEKESKDALRLFKKYTNQKDSLNLLYNTFISGTSNEASSVTALNKTIEDYKLEVEKKERSENFNRVTNIMSVIIIAILSLLTLSLYKNNKLRAKTNSLLKDKNIELQLAKVKAEKASLAKAQFLSTITHELRTPLYAVTGLTQLLMEGNIEESQKEHLNSLKFSGEYLLSLINNILDVNKLEAKKVIIEKISFNLKDRIKNVLLVLEKSTDDNKTKIVFEFDEAIPEKLLGDPLKLSQILFNLTGNSIKFTQNGKVTVRVKKVKERGTIMTLNFEIEDNGIGVSKKKQELIFKSFSQASLQINRKFGGTGLGLSIVKNLLVLMGSKIELESELGQGSKFWFNLDFDIPQTTEKENITETLKPRIANKFLENKKILLVEDNRINQMITKKVLENNKMICQVTDNGIEAIEIINKNKFDVVLMDIHMPGISGIEATKKIRLFDKKTPIIALTAVTLDENLDIFYKAGFNEIIPKPFKTEAFFEIIYTAIQKS